MFLRFIFLKKGQLTHFLPLKMMQHLPHRLQTGCIHVTPYFLEEVVGCKGGLLNEKPNIDPATAPIISDVNAKTVPLNPMIQAMP